MIETILGLDIAKELIVILIAALPIFELRVAIPVAISAFNFPWYYAFLLAFIGNLLPIPFILLFFESIAKFLSKFAFFKRILDWLYNRTRKHGSIVQKYKNFGLVLFVSIPLPVTGAWTGSLAAVLFGINFKKAMISIAIGVFIAGIIVTCIWELLSRQ